MWIVAFGRFDWRLAAGVREPPPEGVVDEAAAYFWTKLEGQTNRSRYGCLADE
jgi:hypothetical protein